MPPDLKLVPSSTPTVPAFATGVGLAVRAFVDVAMKAFTEVVSTDGSPIRRAREALGEDEFLRIARDSIERHVERVLGDGVLLSVAANVGALEVDGAVLDVVGEVIQDIGRAAWSRVAR